MDIHEYQAKDLFRQFGIRTLKGSPADSPEQALRVAKDLGGSAWMVKAQVHAGGRGMGGGIKKATSFMELQNLVTQFIGKKLITHQTGPDGKTVHQVLIEQACEVKKEFYLALLLDRKQESFSVIASSSGGVSIEEIVKKHPEKIFQTRISFSQAWMSFQTRHLLQFLNISTTFFNSLHDLISRLYSLMITKEALLIEINPLAFVKVEGSKQKELVALDAKVSIDDNALFRQEEIKNLRDFRELPRAEQKALAHDLSFVQLKGPIGCLVNGAGLAMATMDIVQFKGGQAANFLDVGGGVNAEKIDIAFQILKEDSNVRGILVNIFGGIVRCDLIAEGLVRAIQKFDIKMPVVVRLEGTRAKEARQVLDSSDCDLHFANNLSIAAEKIISLTSHALRSE